MSQSQPAPFEYWTNKIDDRVILSSQTLEDLECSAIKICHPTQTSVEQFKNKVFMDSRTWIRFNELISLQLARTAQLSHAPQDTFKNLGVVELIPLDDEDFEDGY